jgi:hypothetical protein
MLGEVSPAFIAFHPIAYDDFGAAIGQLREDIRADETALRPSQGTLQTPRSWLTSLQPSVVNLRNSRSGACDRPTNMIP